MIKKIKEYLEEFKINYEESKSIFYFLNKYKILLGGVSAFLGFIFGVIGFLYEGKHLLESMTNTFALFALNTPDSYDETNIFLLLSTIFICITLFSAALFAFFQEFINRFIAKRIIAKNHIAVFGLGEINRAFLNSILNDDKTKDSKESKNSDLMTVIIDSDSTNSYIDEYRQQGFGVIVGDALSSTQLELLNYETMDYALIALGNDRINIELAIKIINKIKDEQINTPTRLIVHISNNELREIFHQEFILPVQDDKIQIDIKTFSFYDECSKDLFENNNLMQSEYLSTNDSFKSVVLGNGNLALSIIKDILLLSNFPNKNKHVITLIDQNSKEFFENIKLETYYDQKKFPTVEFEIIESNWKSPNFYKENIFTDKDLLNIYICYDDEENNVNLAMELKNRIYTKFTSSKTKIHFGIFSEYQLSHLINENKNTFERFFTFGNFNDIFSKEKLLDEEDYIIAKMIHHGYGDIFDENKLLLDKSELDKKWFNNTKFSDKLSNIAQAKHLNTKLQILGLKKEKIDEKELSKVKLLELNKKEFYSIIEPVLKESNISINRLKVASQELPKFWDNKNYEVIYMPTEFKTLFEKLIEIEHERWNSYHYLNGWEYDEIKNKNIKVHDCLKLLNEFKEKHLQITVLYDIYSILYIPNYLASAGFKIKKLD
ncbi:NAD-binding protein [Arcobacter arenosus]|uniref:RCK N-terminal domain-containing protein n=1 Tax=Arcobacter arenosus TaxID=2576037 RepID=A0A5R8XWW2_9BACT|nr:NAD-binding protein [Arcobacter arenosus]TLP35497.1 hypothetical protein FDK22_14695 [Arcobacter arenosus]